MAMVAEPDPTGQPDDAPARRQAHRTIAASDGDAVAEARAMGWIGGHAPANADDLPATDAGT